MIGAGTRIVLELCDRQWTMLRGSKPSVRGVKDVARSLPPTSFLGCITTALARMPATHTCTTLGLLISQSPVNSKLTTETLES